MASPLPTRLFKLYAPTLIASRDPVDGRLRIEGVASSSIKDRHGDQLTLKALKKMEKSAIGMTIFMNHSYDIPKDVFGTVEKSRLSKSGETDKAGEPIYDLRFGIAVASSNPEAKKSFELIETDKVHLGLSIGAMIPEGGASFEKGATPGEGRMVIDDVDLVETSLIGIPANPRAWVDYAMKSFIGVYPDKISPEKHLSLLAAFASDEDVPPAEGDPEIEPVEPTQTISASGEDAIPAPDPEEAEGSDIAFADSHFASAEVTPVKEAWSSAYKTALPDSAFACPKTRKYPHHSKSGAVDRAHLANALARIGDESNDQCGAAHLKAHAAKLGMSEKGVEPDLVADGGGQHPHAHIHDHEHQHGYEGSSLTVHNHEHAHVHSHEHEGDHEHASDMNDYQHDHSHDGSYDVDHAHEGTEEATKTVVPDLAKTRVTVWETEDGKTVEVDTGRSKSKSDGVQSAQTPESETAGGLAEDSESTKALTLDDTEDEALKLAAQTVDDSTGIVKALFAQMVAARGDAASARSERDAAIEVARKTLQSTSEIIEKIGDLPAGRKTGGIVAVKGEFDALKDIYGDDVRKLMKKG